MLPLNYAILKYFTTVDKANADQLISALKPTYSKFKTLNYAAIVEALMTAEKNGLLHEVHYEIDQENRLLVYYSATEDGKKTILKYIG